jgi:uncharacterized metal-binding protein
MSRAGWRTMTATSDFTMKHGQTNTDRMDHAPTVPLKNNDVVVYACSGCSDTGELADRIARRLAHEGVAQMSCLAGIGGQVKCLVARAETAKRILVIDGCPLACARHTFERAGFSNIEHLKLHVIGFRKGATTVSVRNISAGAAAAKRILLQPKPNPAHDATPE